jgi:hypothetical protein
MPDKKSKNQMGERVIDDGYDYQSLSIGRVLLNHLWWERMPYGMHWKRPPLKQFIMLWVHHRFGLLIIKAKLYKKKFNSKR